MNPLLEKYLLQLKCLFINPVNSKPYCGEVIGWHVKSQSSNQKIEDIKSINQLIRENDMRNTEVMLLSITMAVLCGIIIISISTAEIQ